MTAPCSCIADAIRHQRLRLQLLPYRHTHDSYIAGGDTETAVTGGDSGVGGRCCWQAAMVAAEMAVVRYRDGQCNDDRERREFGPWVFLSTGSVWLPSAGQW